VFVKDAEDVALAINYAKASSTPLAVRGGGHSASGASSCEGGIVIDLSRYLKDTKVDPEAKLPYVGGGAIWETVDKAAIEHGLAAVAGTINHVRFYLLCSPCTGPNRHLIDWSRRVCCLFLYDS
jgi:FAD/FMN-containing dehydrogenase